MLLNGVININKEKDWTSQDVCAKLRNRLNIKKIGHAGTLDPLAEGVLPVCIGKGTRIIEFYDEDRKTYSCRMKLGIRTDTFDITGNILSKTTDSDYYFPLDISINDIHDVFSKYIGKIEQIPPKYSAVKIHGKRAYDLARSGESFEIKPRVIEIFSNKVLNYNKDEHTIDFEVVCSKGTYIRTICNDIGNILGCGATMTSLTRTETGYFNISNSYKIKDICNMTDDEITSIIIPMEKTLTNLGILLIPEYRRKAFLDGKSTNKTLLKLDTKTNFKNFYKVYSENIFLGIGRMDESEILPYKVIAT